MNTLSLETRALMSPKELSERLERGDRLQLIDVRSAREFEEGHVPGAINMPLEQVNSRLADLNSVDPAILICQSGRRAEMCRNLLEDHRDQLVVLEGGTGAWVNAGLPVVRTRATLLPLMRQVQIVAGSMAFAGAALGYWVNPAWGFLSMFVGLGLFIAGTTGFCGMANLLAAMPWNRAVKSSGSTSDASCCR